MVEKAQIQTDIAAALDTLGEAWRGDWSMFDGRTLRWQLNQLSKALRQEEFNYRVWAAEQDICPACQSWTEHCHCRD